MAVELQRDRVTLFCLPSARPRHRLFPRHRCSHATACPTDRCSYATAASAPLVPATAFHVPLVPTPNIDTCPTVKRSLHSSFDPQTTPTAMRIVLLLGLIVHTTAIAGSERRVNRKSLRHRQDAIQRKCQSGENFYLHANEKWLETTEIPGDKSNYGIFTILNDKTQEQVRTLIEAAAESQADKGSAAQKVGDLYSSVLDVKARNAAGIEPIRGTVEVDRWHRVQTGCCRSDGRTSRYQVGMPLVPYVSVDAKNSDAYTVYLTQSGLTMPDRDYYLSDEERYVKMREAVGRLRAEDASYCGAARSREGRPKACWKSKRRSPKHIGPKRKTATRIRLITNGRSTKSTSCSVPSPGMRLPKSGDSAS